MTADPFRIVIVGGGTAGWMCAAGLARQLPAGRYTIDLIESDEIGTVGVGEATLPHIKAFNDMLGIDEAQFMRDTQATFKLGIEFVGWDRAGGRYIHPFGQFGQPWTGVDFQHHFTRAQQAGIATGSFADYSFGVAACLAGGFEFPNEDDRSIRSTYSYAYHFDAGLYAGFLRNWATARGVSRLEGRIVHVAQDSESGDIRNVVLHSGAEIAGDLFIDCSGFRSLLLGATMGVAWLDWSEWLPCDRALALPSARVAPLTPFTRASAQRAGWTWRIPLQHRTGNGYVFSSRYCDEDAARETLLSALDGPPLAEPRLLRFQAGRRKLAWQGNCVAIGLASGFLEPLESTSIFLIQAAIADLVNMMPREDDHAIDHRLAAEFNRLFEIHYDRTRDFLVLHYTANDRTGEPLWDHVRTMTLPDSLAHKIRLFQSSAIAPDYKLGLFSRDSWLAVLIGQSVAATGFSPLAESLPLAELETLLADLRARISSAAGDLTAHDDFIASYCAASSDAANIGATAA